MAMVMDCAHAADAASVDASNITTPAVSLCIFFIQVPLFFVSDITWLEPEVLV